jgi:hypothetical protein
MKTAIFISGQITGNSKLRNAIITADCEERRGMFYSITLTFPTKKAAVKALSKAYKYMKCEEPLLSRGIGGISYRRAHAINYDASRAVIQ